DLSAQVEEDGVFVVPKPVNRPFFYQAVKLASASRRRMLSLEQQNMRLQQKIEEIRLVDRAKCTLIEVLKLSEAQAHRYIEKQAMDMRITRREVAENILKTYES
ncbi:MAG: ANTAR domain-containing response regulator, partial [Christensenellaceae bacterium]